MPDKNEAKVTLVAFENGSPVTNRERAKEIAKAAGLGEPTDAAGWGIWEVPE